MLHFENVGMRYGIGPEILRDLNFSLGEGSFNFLTGPSVAGKTTLLKLMYLALKPTRGLVHLLGHDIALTPRSELPMIRRQIGVVFQEFRLIPHLSAFDNVALPLRISEESEAIIEKHVKELLGGGGLGNQILAKPSILSGGQQQRVAIARAIITKPRLLLADEPTGNVDDNIALRLMHLFEELNKTGTTVIIATHNQKLIEKLDHPVMELTDGELKILNNNLNRS